MPEIYLFNSLGRTKQLFKAIESNKVKIYGCGITTYDKTHFGHLRSALFGDLLCRVFKACGYEVTYIKNFTDIDDKIISRANAEKLDWKKLSQDMIKLHDSEMKTLGISFPDIAPLATKHIPEMQAMIKDLLEKDLAYSADGDIFFRTTKIPDYGKLSGKDPAELIAGWRVDLNIAKQNPLDFVLWKKAKPNEPSFPSPWGAGRPGWHIECSAMSYKYLGEKFDIHIGGSDLIFPHHENEIAQSEGLFETKHVNYWLHNEMVRINGQKMSKSLNNFLTTADLIDQYSPEVIRFFLLSTHYRRVIDFKKEHLVAAAQGLDRLYQALVGNEAATTLQLQEDPKAQKHSEEFLSALTDDINTPKAISLLYRWVKLIHTSKDAKTKALMQASLVKAGKILGLLQVDVDTWFSNPRLKQFENLSAQQIEEYIEERNQARAEKNWEKADQIRNTLLAKKIRLVDQDNSKTTWVHINT